MHRRARAAGMCATSAATKGQAVQQLQRIQMLAERKHADVVELCYNKLSEYQAGKDLVVINGWRQGGLSFNADLATHLDAPVLLSMDLTPGEPTSSVYERAVRRRPNSPAACCLRCAVPSGRRPGAVAFTGRTVQMAAVQEYRHKRCSVLGLALGEVPLDTYDEVHRFMKDRLEAQQVTHLGAPPLS